MNTSKIIINSSIIYEEREHIRHDLERRLCISGVIRGRKLTEQRLRKQDRALWWGINDIEVAPKYQRKLAESSEEQVMAPLVRYGGNAIPKQLMTFDRYRCKCDYCVFKPEERERRKKETELMIRRFASGKQICGRHGYLDFDMQMCEIDHFEEYAASDEDEKIAGPAILDLMAMAKPARRRRRPQVTHIPRKEERLSLSAPVPLSTIGSVSGLEDEESWENIEDSDIDLSVVDLGAEEEDWECWSDGAH